MKMKSIIKMVREPEADLNERIAEITGQIYVRKPYYFVNQESGEEYYAITGGLSFPRLHTPGFSVIVAVVKDEQNLESPILKVVEEIEEQDLNSLFGACEKVRHRWGYPKNLELFYGDPERFQQSLFNFNKKQKAGLYLCPPSDFEDHNRTEIYLQTIMDLLRGDGKRLFIGDCKRLRTHLQNLPTDVKNIEDYPSIAALGYVAHSLIFQAPWLQFTNAERYVSTDMGAYDEVFGSWDDE